VIAFSERQSGFEVNIPWKQVVDPVDRMICNAVKDDAEVFKRRIKLLHLCRLFSLRSLSFANNQAVNRRGPISASI
jgi:hypothetical protein